MPQLNRDKDSLYAPGKLSLWFLATSGVLFACLVWMLWADFDRPWKTTQRDFYKRQARLLEIQAKVNHEALLSDEKTTAELADLSKKIADAKKALATDASRREIADLEAVVTEQQARVDEQDRIIKSDKGAYSEERYQLEMARQHGAAEQAADHGKEINALSSHQFEAENLRRAAEVARDAAKARLESIRGGLKELERKRDEALKAWTDIVNQQAAAAAKTDKNQWRNFPVADFLSPSIQIDKATLEYIHEDYTFATTPKVDMCMTCHRGIDRPFMTEESIRDLLAEHLHSTFGEKAWETLSDSVKTVDEGDDGHDVVTWLGRMRGGSFKEWVGGPAPSLSDLFPEKDVTKTLSNLGDATAKTSLERALADAGILDPFRVEKVQWAHPHLDLMVGSTSKHKMGAVGCTVCHHGRGWSADFRTAAHNPQRSPAEAAREEKEIEAQLKDKRALAYPTSQTAKPAGDELAKYEGEIRELEARLADVRQEDRWAHAYGWKEPEYIDFPMLPLKYVEGQCQKCHKPGLTYPHVSERLDPRTIVNAKDGSTKTMPAPNPVDGPASLVDHRWHPEKLEHGAKTMREWGCVGCHKVKDFGACACEDARGNDDPLAVPAPGTLSWAGDGPPKVAWDLRHIGDKTTPEFVKRWLMNPPSYRIDTRMPSFWMYRLHDDHYKVVGAPVDVPVVVEPGPRDVAQRDVEVAAITAYLFSAQQYRPLFDKAKGTYPKVPEGDAKNGAKVFYSMNCYGCHIGRGMANDKGEWVKDEDLPTKDAPFIGMRFEGRPDIAPGPRLTALGSKVKAEWLYEWLREPRHYWSTTRMPNNRFHDETGPDGKTVVRTADQLRADVVAYLMEGKDAEFEAQKIVDPEKGADWTREHVRVLNDMWLEWYGKGQKVPVEAPDATGKVTEQPWAPYAGGELATAEAAAKFVEDRPAGNKLEEVGRKLVGARGCFGCHNIAWFEKEQPIGKELQEEGSQDIHKFDFGVLSHAEVPHTRWDWIDHKLDQPRLYDKGRFKPRWPDKLRMPRFNFRTQDREAVVTTVLGLVKEPIFREAQYRPTLESQRLALGRAVVERYNCNQCHTIEGRVGVLTKVQLQERKELWMLPPNLYGEGNRVNADWLFRFVKNPDNLHASGGTIRPSTIQRMPMFHLSDAEATALVDYFETLADRPDRLTSDPLAAPLDATPYAEPVTIHVKAAKAGDADKTLVVHDRIEEAKALFDTFNCVKCHLRKGTPGADPNEGASAPPFFLARERLQRSWMISMLHDPQWQIANTKMTAFWPKKRGGAEGATRTVNFPDFTMGERGKPDATPDRVAEAQMDALARYILYHFEDAKPATSTGK